MMRAPKTSMVFNLNGKERNLVGWPAYLLIKMLGVFVIIGAMDIVSVLVAFAFGQPFDVRWGALVISTICLVMSVANKSWGACLPWTILIALAFWSLRTSGLL